MKNLNLFFYSILLGFGISACSPKYYAPDTHNVPLISKKGETNIALAGTLDLEIEQIEFQASRGITKNIAIKANGGLYKPIEISTGENRNGSGKFIEFGAGYFKPLRNSWIFEAYGIYGRGSVKNSYTMQNRFRTNGIETISANLTRIGIQPNFGFKNENFLFALSSRFVKLSYQNINGELVYEGESQKDYLRANNQHFLIEPALTFGAGLDGFSFRIHTGFSLNLTNPTFRQYDASAAFSFNYSF